MIAGARGRVAFARALLRAAGGGRSHAASIARAGRAFATAETSSLLEREFHRHVRGRRERAEAAVAAAEALAAVSREPALRASALRLSGVLDHLDGRSGRAARKLERAAALLESSGDGMRAGDVRRSLMDVYMLLGEDRRARACAAAARRNYARAGGADPGRVGRLEMNEGNLHHRRDRHREALASYARARRAFRRAGESLRLAEVDFNEANILASLDLTVRARAGYERARAAFCEAGLAGLAAQAETAIAAVDILEGNTDAALEGLLAVREKLVKLRDRIGAAHADLDAADALLRLNRPADAALLATRADGVFRRARQDMEQALCAQVLGGAALATGRPAAARLRFARAGEIQRRAGNAVGAAFAEIGLAQAHQRSGRPSEAVALARRAAAVLGARRLRSRQARALSVGAAAALAGGDARLAAVQARRAAALAARTGDLRVLMAARLVLGRVEEERGRWGSAFREFVAAARCVEGMRRGVTAEESRLAFAIDKSEVYEAIVSNRLRKGGAAAVREALRYAERGKARMLAERIASTGGARHAPATALVERFRQAERLLAIAESRAEDPAVPRGVRGVPGLASLVSRRRTALRVLARRDPERAAMFGALPDPLEAARALAHDELVLEFAQSDGWFHVFAIGSEGVEARRAVCKVADVDGVLGLLRFQLAKGGLGADHADRFAPFLQAMLRGYLERLHGLLLAGVDDRIDGRRVRIVPHGILHGLPFHALESGGRALVDRCEVSYVPSLALAGLLSRRRDRATSPPLLLGVPDNAAPEIEEEVRLVQDIVRGARVFRGADATLSALRLSEQRPSFLHVACHGFYGGASGAWSGGLRLGDAWLSLEDLYALRATADLVVLSGCETGRGTVYSGDEWVGLVRGFLQAGARSVVASLWEVHDASAARLMADFYRGLAGGQTVAASLTHAQRLAKQRDPLVLRWAPFMAVGDPAWMLSRSAEAA